MTPDEWNTLLMECRDPECPDKVNAARDRLFSLYCNKVYKYLLKLSEGEHLASDLVQQTFEYVLARLNKFRGSQSAFEGFLLTAAKNKWRHHRRKTGIDRLVDSFLDIFGSKDTDGKLTPDSAGAGAITDPEKSPEEKLMMQEDGLRLSLRVLRALEAVTEPYRTPLILRDHEDYSYEEIAKILDRPRDTIAGQIRRGRAQFKEEYNRLTRQEEAEERMRQGGRR